MAAAICEALALLTTTAAAGTRPQVQVAMVTVKAEGLDEVGGDLFLCGEVFRDCLTMQPPSWSMIGDR